MLLALGVVIQMSTDVLRIAWSFPSDYGASPASDSTQTVAFQALENDFNQRCTATKWIVTNVIEIPLDHPAPLRTAVKAQSFEE
ncbi:MAG: hypothetical protein QM754_13935 [Tepidisphaeraceae bacterium]